MYGSSLLGLRVDVARTLSLPRSDSSGRASLPPFRRRREMHRGGLHRRRDRVARLEIQLRGGPRCNGRCQRETAVQVHPRQRAFQANRAHPRVHMVADARRRPRVRARGPRPRRGCRPTPGGRGWLRRSPGIGVARPLPATSAARHRAPAIRAGRIFSTPRTPPPPHRPGAEYLRGRTGLANAPIQNHHHPIPQGHRLHAVVGHQNAGHAARNSSMPQLPPRAQAGGGIERRERLIEQQQRRLRRQRAGQGHALLLAAGNWRG